ncbi:MAG: NlpC/P60 family protein [Ectobacillus sp.]
MKMVTCALAAGLMMFSTAAPGVKAERTQAELQQNLHTQQQERNELQKQMDELKKTIETLEKSIQENEKKLTETKENITETEKLIQQKTIEIAELEKAIQQREEVIKKRLVSLQNQPASNMVTEVVVNATSFADLLDRLSSVNLILQSDKGILEAQNRDKEQVKADRELIVKKEQELRAYMEELEKTKNELLADQDKKQGAWNELNDKFQKIVAEMSNTESALKELEKQSLFLQRTAQNNEPAPSAVPVNNAPKAVKQPVQVPAAPANGGVVAKAAQYLGVPYVFGGASPSGFDCSGFISYVYGKARTNVEGYWASVTKISEPQPGDLVFFQNTYKPGPSHIGIYVGNNTMIHASDKGIAYSNLGSSYNRAHFLGYGRF